jgi:hypothetical protein
MNFKNAVCYAALLLVSLSCSDETVERPLSLKGQVKGNVLLRTEYNTLEDVQSEASVTLEGSETPIKAFTDVDGNFTLENVPTGSYRFVVEKEGFYTYRSPVAFGVMGGSEPLYSYFALSRPPTSYMENLEFTFTGPNLSMSGTVVHHHPQGGEQFLQFVVFFHNVPDVSPDNYLDLRTLSAFVASGSEYSWATYINPVYFTSGSTMYAVVYAYSGSVFYDALNGKYTFYGLGPPSEVLSIQIP